MRADRKSDPAALLDVSRNAHIWIEIQKQRRNLSGDGADPRHCQKDTGRFFGISELSASAANSKAERVVGEPFQNITLGDRPRAKLRNNCGLVRDTALPKWDGRCRTAVCRLSRNL